MVALVMVTFNRLDILKSNLEYIFDQKRLPDFFVIVNNGSTDGTMEFLSSFSQIHVIHEPSNKGYGYGLAQGIKFAKSAFSPDFYWLMDDDSFPNREVLSFLMDEAPKLKVEGILGLTGFKMFNGIPREIKSFQQPQKADFVLVDNALLSGICVDKVGNFREDLFMMCEDYEYCLRLKKNGYFVGVVNSDSVTVNRMHLGSQPNSKGVIWRGYYHARNHFLILRADFSLVRLFFYFFRQSKYLIHASLFGQQRWLKVRFRLIGVWHGISGVTGKTLDPNTFEFIKN
jgi:rhamnopyranosyl-N-acetylglucosaminyl-diphospho-decaprenol beta-1,3/1,4-galactofuranosyltransferase